MRLLPYIYDALHFKSTIFCIKTVKIEFFLQTIEIYQITNLFFFYGNI